MRRYLTAATLVASLLFATNAFSADATTDGATTRASDKIALSTDWDKDVYAATHPTVLFGVPQSTPCARCDEIEANLAKIREKHPEVGFVKVQTDSLHHPIVQFRLPGRIGATIQLQPYQLASDKIEDSISKHITFALSEWELMKEVQAQKDQNQVLRDQAQADADGIINKIKESDEKFAPMAKQQQEEIDKESARFDDLIARLKEMKEDYLRPFKQAQEKTSDEQFNAAKPLRKSLDDRWQEYGHAADANNLKASKIQGLLDKMIEEEELANQQEAN